MGTYSVKRLVIVTGMSGSGKTSMLNLLEDQGLFAIDNIPINLLPQLLDLLGGHEAAILNGVVAVVDVRSDHFLHNFVSITEKLRNELDDFSIVYLDASDDVLIRRFSTTRRRHPLGDTMSVIEGIRKERELLKPVQKRADSIIDTSRLKISDFRPEILRQLGDTRPAPLIFCSSFGFKHGIPHDSDYVIDVRFLPNPYYVPELRNCTGKDKEVKNYIKENFKDLDEFMTHLFRLFSYVISKYFIVGKNPIQIAIGCTGGHHRSVFIVECLADKLRKNNIPCHINHRDIDKP